MESMRKCLCNCHRKLFGFTTDVNTHTDFVLSQWSDRPIVYALYRSVLSAYTLSIVVYTGISSEYGWKIIIWLTYWSYYILTAGFLIRALTVWLYIYRLKHKDRPRLPEPLLRLQWVLITLTCVSAPVVSLLFWTVDYKGNGVDFNSGNSHGVNLVLVVLDLFISRYPIRIQHFYVNTCYCFTYSLFTVIYWSLGGTNHLGQSYVYGVLDYSEDPGLALTFVFSVSLLVGPAIHCIIYGMYRARTALWDMCFVKKQRGLPETIVSLNDVIYETTV